MQRFWGYPTHLSFFVVLGLVGAIACDFSQGQVFSRTLAQQNKRRSTAQVRQASYPQAKSPQQPLIQDPAIEEVAWFDYQDDPCCGDVCDVACGTCVNRCGKACIYGGFEAVMIKPRFESNLAFNVLEGDGSTVRNFNDVDFDYDLEFTPRAFFGWRHQDGVGLRATWWLFDHEAATATASPADNSFGRISHPTFGSVDISINDPDHTFSANSALDAYAIDLEATKMATFCSWDLGVGCGVRYAYTEQYYRAQSRNDANVLTGQIDYRHLLEGIGPTISLEAFRPIAGQISIFGKARGSVLFGDGESSLTAGEDLDLANPLTTTQTSSRDDLLSIAEIQLGFRWIAAQKRSQSLRPFLSFAMEGQVWNGAGNASSEEGTLGFFGFNSGAGVEW